MTLNGPPVQVQPYVSEPGVPLITINPGTPNPFAGADGNGAGTGTGTGTGDGGTSGGTVADSTALSTMMGTDWGSTAIANAQSVGVNPSALAATCVLESGCQNVSTSGAQGVFQMYPAAFSEGLQTALAANPALASQIVQGSAGMNDPTTEAIAASGYLMQAAQSLQSAGISDPSVSAGSRLLQFRASIWRRSWRRRPDGQPIATVLSGMSQSALAANGITAGRNCRAVADECFREDRKRCRPVCPLNVTSGVDVDGKVCDDSYGCASDRVRGACPKRAGGSIATWVSVQRTCSCLEWPGSDASPRSGVRRAGAIRKASRNRDVHADRRRSAQDSRRPNPCSEAQWKFRLDRLVGDRSVACCKRPICTLFGCSDDERDLWNVR